VYVCRVCSCGGTRRASWTQFSKITGVDLVLIQPLFFPPSAGANSEHPALQAAAVHHHSARAYTNLAPEKCPKESRCK